MDLADLAPLLAEAPPIPLHAIVAMAALVVGALQLALPKGTRRHVSMGRAWVLALGFEPHLSRGFLTEQD